jgi:agmatine/peptidylarginine deiminase
MPLTLEGGNLLSNGDGLCLTSTTVFPKNAGRNVDQSQLGAVLADYLGATQWAYLDPLSGESTGHIDLFCSFLAKDLVVVGQYDPKADDVNAKLLDHAAQVLSTIRTSAGPMRVARIPMPPPVDGRYRSYTNVLFADGVLVVPLYPQIDGKLDKRALAIYKELMPTREVIGIDISEMALLGGGLHCMSTNVCAGTTADRADGVSRPGLVASGVESVGLLRA